MAATSRNGAGQYLYCTTQSDFLVGFMKNMRAQCITIGIFMALLLSGCAKPGAEYLGKWVNKKSPKDQFEITRNGDNFLVRKTRQGIFGKEQTTTIPATLKDGILQSQAGPLTATLTYVKATDTLTTL